MYSVEDLLISHGYKLPRKHSPPPAPRRAPGEGGAPYGYPSRSSSALGSLTSASGSTSSSQRDLAHSHGRSVLADPGFYDGQRGLYVQPHSGDRGMTYWKRRGQDFSALLDYADARVPMGVAVPRPESRSMSARERELALQQWRLAAERRQHGEGGGAERWAQPQQPQQHQHPHHPQQQQQQEQPRRPRTAEGAVPPRSKAKSQSLPRMVLSTGPPPGRVCLSAGPSSLQLHEGGAWMANSAPQARARQSRPPRPPSYEVHQQTRANVEGSMSRAPSRQEYCHSEPPGYMPPPSYRRQPIMGGHGYRELLASYMYRHDPYQQALPLSEGVQWYARQAGTSWPDHHSDGRRSAPCRAVFPVYSEDGRGVVQYIPFDDPRVRHISGGLLTDADKIRNIQNEIPGITVSEQSPDDSAFLSPQESLDSSVDVGPSSCHQAQWPSYPDNLSSAPDLNRNPGDLNRNPAEATTPDPTSGKRQPFSSRQSSSSDQGFSETITQVKKFEPEPDSKKPTRRRQKETMFCLVSVPITPQAVARDDQADQNNNNKAPSPTVMSMVTQPSNQSHIVSSQPVSIPDPQPAPSSPLDSRMARRAPLRRELVDAWTLQARCSGSWPGDQYRNQQTQTGSPEITRVPPPSSQPAPDAPSSDSTTDSGLGTDCCPSYGLPMKGQRSISPSSTSAFSRTGQPGLPSPSRLRSPPKTPPAPSPRRNAPPPSSPRGQEVFGQFLLKPVGRRPWDAIGELESFNKESQKVQEPTAAQQNNSEPSRTRSTEPLDMLEYKDDADKMDISPIVDDWGLSELVPLYRRTRGSPCWSEDQAAGNRLPGEELNGRQESSLLLEQSLGSPRVAERQDIPVPQESLLRDVGLTVYTPDPHKEAPEESYSALVPSADTQPARDPQSDKLHSHAVPQATEVPSPDKRGDAPTAAERTLTSVTVRRQRFRFSSEGPAFLTASLPTFSPEELDEEEDEVLGALLSKVKRRPPSEDLSPLYQVQSAMGIPQNESIEERAARILGISVPAESLVSAGQSREEMEDDPFDDEPFDEPFLSASQNEGSAPAEVESVYLNEGGPSMTSASEKEPELVDTETAEFIEKEELDERVKEEEGRKEEEEEEEEMTQAEVKEQEEEENKEETVSQGGTEVPGETTEEGEINVAEGETALNKLELAEGESLTANIGETTEQEDDSIATRRTETAVSAETAVSEEEPAEVSVSQDGAGAVEEVAVDGCDIAKEAAASETEISGSVEVGEEAVEMAEEVEAEEEVPDQEEEEEEEEEEEVRQVSRELGELQLAVCRGLGEEEQDEEGDASGSPDSYIAIATLEMPEILSIVEEEEDDEEDTGLGLYCRRSACLQERVEVTSFSSYTHSYLTLGHAGREGEEEEEEKEEEKEKEEQAEEEVEEVLMEIAQTEEHVEEEVTPEEKQEGLGDVKAAEEERQTEGEERGEEENSPEKEETDVSERLLNQDPEEEECIGLQQGEEEEAKPRWAADEAPHPGVRPTPLPRNTVVKREIRLPLAALEDADTYPTSDSYDPSRVERV